MNFVGYLAVVGDVDDVEVGDGKVVLFDALEPGLDERLSVHRDEQLQALRILLVDVRGDEEVVAHHLELFGTVEHHIGVDLQTEKYRHWEIPEPSLLLLGTKTSVIIAKAIKELTKFQALLNLFMAALDTNYKPVEAARCPTKRKVRHIYIFFSSLILIYRNP